VIAYFWNVASDDEAKISMTGEVDEVVNEPTQMSCLDINMLR
jgi:hypothetical protein